MRKYHGVRIQYQGNVLYCSAYRTTEENMEHAKKALCLLLDTDVQALFGKPEGEKSLFEQLGGTVDLFYVRGKG